MNYPLKISNYDRLFTFGCSFTVYRWPTWADILGLCFKEHQNWAKQGAGNQFIAESISECDLFHKLNSRDLVVIAFSSYPRFDYYKDNNWMGKGSILNNQTPDFLEKYYCEKGYILKTLNMINLSLTYLKSKKVDYILTTMRDLTTPFGNGMKYGNIKELYPEFTRYYDELFTKEQYATPIVTYIRSVFSDNDYYYDANAKIDLHPTPKMHHSWLDRCISKKFISFNDDEKQLMSEMAHNETTKLLSLKSRYSYPNITQPVTKRI